MGNLNLWLHNNHLTDDPNDYFGRVKTSGTLTLESIADRILSEGIELQRETLVDVLSRAERMKIDGLAEGYSINTPTCYARVGVQGVFAGASAQFSKDSHKVNASFTAGKDLRDALANIQVDVLGVASTGPVIGQVIDTLSGDTDSTLTPNNVLKILGDRIKVAGESADVGVFFINQSDQSRTQVVQIISNNPSELMVMVPALAAGDYELEVVTQFSGGSSLTKEPRSATFDQILVVS